MKKKYEKPKLKISKIKLSSFFTPRNYQHYFDGLNLIPQVFATIIAEDTDADLPEDVGA